MAGHGAKGVAVGVLGFLGFAALAALIGFLVYAALGWRTQLLFPIVTSLFLAVILPVTTIAIRHQIRLTRIKLISLFATTFDLSMAAPGAAGREGAPVSFEFVKGKYYVDLDLRDGEEPKLETIPRFPMMLHADWMLLVCALPLMAYSFFWGFILFAPIIEVLEPEKSISGWLWASFLSLGGAPVGLIRDPDMFAAAHANLLTVGAFCFAGAYFYCVRLLLRAVGVFDLSPLTFLRAFAHMVLATTLAIVLYRVFPSVAGAADFIRDSVASVGLADKPAPGAIPGPDPRDGVNSIWLMLSFALGFVPDAALQYVLQRSGVRFKDRYVEIEEHAKTVPLTILDGVDAFTAFRLEEANIFDIQNLATANPIMIHIENPYGIYEAIDWVAQAQLCTVVGPERFLLLKSYNIRTIFDLERAVLPEESDETLIDLVGAVLLTDHDRNARCRRALKFEPTYAGAAPADAPDRLAHNAEALTRQGVRRLVRLMIDDLHVHRLRQIWMLIAEKIGAQYALLDAPPKPAAAPRSCCLA